MYRIKDISNLTGLKPATIRMWEKRYNLITPKRTDTNIRLYSDQDLVKLLNTTLLIKNNFKISKISLLSDDEINQQIKLISTNNSTSDTLKLFVKALTTIDETLFEEAVNRALKKEGLKKVYLNAFIPLFEKIGLMWQAGSISPVQEHFISNLVRQTIIVETSKLKKPPKGQPVDFILFCREGEFHELSLLFYNYCLIKQNFKTLYLGQSVPFKDLIEIGKLVLPKKGYVTSVLNTIDQNKLEDYFINLNQALKSDIYGGGKVLNDKLLNNLAFLKPVKSII